VIKIFKKEDGAVLMISIIMISVLLVLVTALAGSINSNISFTKRNENNIKAFYTAEAGIEKGIKFIADSNLYIAMTLLGGLFLVGPSITILENLMSSFGDYLSNLIRDSFMLAPYDKDYKSWLNGWTIFYWAWWIAWAPFVGTFIARISRGR